MSQKLFNALGTLHNVFRNQNWLTSPVHYFLERWALKGHRENLAWQEEAEQVMADQVQMRAKKLLYWIAAVLIVLLIWAGFAKVDEVIRGEGRVTPSRQVQVIQSLDGGIVSQLLVREGQTVKIGDPLVRIDETRAIATLRENRSQYLSFLARQARLTALSNGTNFDPPDEIKRDNPLIFEQEYALYSAAKAELASQVDIARQQLLQREKELSEAHAKLEQAEKGYELTNQELTVTRPLVNSGAVSEVDLLRLERDVARFRGEREQTKAQIERIKSAIDESRRKISEVEQNFRSKVRTELSENTAKLNSSTETSVGLKDKVTQATLKSPVNGTISRLFFNTVGGVIQPGKDVLEVVPSDDALVLETKIQPKDIAFVTPNQKAAVKLTAYDYTIYGTLDAVVENVAANSVVDDKGNAYYIVRVHTLRTSLGKGLPIIPGMIAQVDIITGQKTILSYLLKPVLKAKSYAFTER